MHVTKTHHRRVMLIMGGVILLLAIATSALALLSFSTETVDNTGADNRSEYLTAQEAVVIETEEEETMLPVEPTGVRFVEVTESCDHAYQGDECVQVYSGPGTEHSQVTRLREGIVLRVGGQVERNDETWYKITFDEWLRYPERVEHEWYVAARDVEVLYNEGVKTTWDDGATTTDKQIIVDKSEQRLYAYDGDTLFMETTISTGLELSPTPLGSYSIFKKMPSRYMQGPIEDIPASDHYDLPGVPWNLYFTEGGAVIHGTYWHESFGSPYSHGCVNLPPSAAEELYNWAELGTEVTVRN